MTSVIVTNPDVVSDDEREVEMEDEGDERNDPSTDETTKSVVKAKKRDKGTKKKGRGFREEKEPADDRYQGKAGQFESVSDRDAKSSAQKSIEGYIVFVTGVNEEAQEDDLYDLFAECGEIKQLHLNLDRRTGYVKGYALIEYEHFDEAKNAIDSLNGTVLLEHKITVDWAFKKTPGGGRSSTAASASTYRGRTSTTERRRRRSQDKD